MVIIVYICSTMPKVCQKDGCSYNVFGKGYCRYHQYMRTDKKKPKPLSKASKKELTRRAKYMKARAEYLRENPVCEVSGCNHKADQIHHRKGRVGDLLFNKDFFFATHIECHHEIETNPKWAYENNYSIRRNARD